MKATKQELLIIAVIVILAFAARLYKLDNPIADWHSWRQADTAAVARNFYQEGFNPFFPKGDDMSAISGNEQPNVERYRFVEFPIYNSLVYFGYLLAGGVDERIARLISALFSLGSIVFLWLIARRHFDRLTGLLAAGIYAFLPFNVYFSRTVLPEPSQVCFCLGMFFFLEIWIEKPTIKIGAIAGSLTALAMLSKPTSVFFLFPLLYTYFQTEGKLWPIKKRYWLMAVVGLLPYVLWRMWMSQYPDGIPASDWLFNYKNIRFKPVFWQWIISDRLGREILSVCGTVLFFIGLLVRPLKEERWLMHLLAFSLLGYVIVFASGNVQHDYYQYIIIPPLAIFVARGIVLFWKGSPFFLPRILTFPVIVVFVMMIFYSTWSEVKGLYQINDPNIVAAGQEANKILPKDAIVIAPYNGSTAFLYQVNRHGFPFVILPTVQMVSKYNVSYFISTAKDSKTKWEMRHFTVVEDTDKFVIIDLTKPNKDASVNDLEPGS